MKKMIPCLAMASLILMGSTAYALDANTAINTKTNTSKAGSNLSAGNKGPLQNNSKATGQINKNINAWREEDCGKQITPGNKGVNVQK